MSNKKFDPNNPKDLERLERFKQKNFIASQRRIDKENKVNKVKSLPTKTYSVQISHNTTDNEIESISRNILIDMSKEEIVAKAEKEKSSRITGFVILITCAMLLTGLTIYCLVSHQKFSSIFWALLFSVGFYIFAFLYFKPKMFKWDYKEWALFSIEISLKRLRYKAKITQKQIDEVEKIDGKKIKHTKIIDQYTDYSDKLHAVLNYQEIIQHRIYKFLVTFEDNTTSIYSAEEGSKLYNKLILHIRNEESIQPIYEKQSSADEIRKYKQLLDDKTTANIYSHIGMQEKKQAILKIENLPAEKKSKNDV